MKKTTATAGVGEEDEALKVCAKKLRTQCCKDLEEQEEPDPEPSSEEEPQLIAKVPDEILAQQRAMQEGQILYQLRKKVNHALEGQNALTAKQWSSAIESYNKAYQTDPNPEYLSSIGFAQFKSGTVGFSQEVTSQCCQ